MVQAAPQPPRPNCLAFARVRARGRAAAALHADAREVDYGGSRFDGVVTFARVRARARSLWRCPGSLPGRRRDPQILGPFRPEKGD